MRGFCRKQSPVLENRESNRDEVVFATSIDGVPFLYNSMATQFDFAAYIMSNKPGARYCNELLYSHVCAGYFDIDCKDTLCSLGFEERYKFVDTVNTFLKNCYMKYMSLELKTKHFYWSCSSRPEKCVSYHIIVKNPDYYFCHTNEIWIRNGVRVNQKKRHQKY